MLNCNKHIFKTLIYFFEKSTYTFLKLFDVIGFSYWTGLLI